MMCKIDPNICEVWNRNKMKIEKRSLTKKNLFDFSCKKTKYKFCSLDLISFKNINVFFSEILLSVRYIGSKMAKIDIIA